MRTKPHSAYGAIAIGIASTVAVFALHRTVIFERPSGGSPRLEPAESLDPAPLFDRGERSPDEAAHSAGDELIARAQVPAEDNEPPASADGRAEEAASPHIEALRHPSPVYRNVSLMTVIREAGFVCVDITWAAAGDEDLGAWRVSCDGVHAYLISEDGAGGLRVEPMTYFDAPVPAPIQLVPEPTGGTPRLLPPLE